MKTLIESTGDTHPRRQQDIVDPALAGKVLLSTVTDVDSYRLAALSLR